MSEKLTQAQIKSEIEQKIWAIVRVLCNGDRVELIPVKGGIKAMRVDRKEIKNNE